MIKLEGKTKLMVDKRKKVKRRRRKDEKQKKRRRDRLLRIPMKWVTCGGWLPSGNSY